MAGDVTISPHPDGSVVDVWVIPGARRTEIVGSHDGALRVRVAAPPEKGRANRAVAKVLENATGTRSAYLLTGGKTRRKRFVIVGVAPADLAARLG